MPLLAVMTVKMTTTDDAAVDVAGHGADGVKGEDYDDDDDDGDDGVVSPWAVPAQHRVSHYSGCGYYYGLRRR